MHSRRRSTGDAFRSSSVGSSLSSARVSSEATIRGHRMYSPEYRNFNRSFGRTLNKSYSPISQPPRRADIFMEAGRLAAEYLVSQGLLHPSILPGKLQNDNLKGSKVGKFHESRMHLRENDLASEGRNNVFSRVGTVPDVCSARRKLSDDFISIGHRNHTRSRKKMVSYRGIDSDWGKEKVKKGHWPVKTRAYPDSEHKNGFCATPCEEEQTFSFDFGGRNSKVISSEQTLKSEIVGESKTKINPPVDFGSKASSGTSKDITPETDAELGKGLDNANALNNKEVINAIIGDKMVKNVQDDLGDKNCSVKDEPMADHGDDLLSLCRFAKVPTKPRSLLTPRMPRIHQNPGSEERTAFDVVPATLSDIEVHKSVPMEGDSGETSTYSSKGLAIDVSKVSSIEPLNEAVHMDTSFIAERERSADSPPLLDGSFMHEHESSDGPPGFEKKEYMVLSNKDERFIQHLNAWDANGEPGQATSSGVSQCDGASHLQNSNAQHLHGEVDKLSPDQNMAAGEKMSVEGDLTPKAGDAPVSEVREEKQLSLSSFKICDLNLMDASEIVGSHDGLTPDHVSTAHADLVVETEASNNVGLSINESLSQFDDYHGLMNDGKEPMAVNAAKDSVTEDKVFDASEQKTEKLYPSLDNFFNHTESAVGLPDVHDGYGNAISHLLDGDMSNCSAVPSGIDELQTQLSLHGHEGILGEDDPIFLALGEIPFSMSGFLGVWDQSTQDYGRPF